MGTGNGRSVLDLGIDRYMERVRQARAANPRVLIVPGVEVLPHYYWTGSPLALDMTVHATQKNLLVFGLDEAALHALPVAGNKFAGFGWSSVLDALPAVLVVIGGQQVEHIGYVAAYLARNLVRQHVDP